MQQWYFSTLYHYDCIQFVYLRTQMTHHMSLARNYKRLLAKFSWLCPLGPLKYASTFCACAKGSRERITSHIVCNSLWTPTCDISAKSVNCFLRNMKLPSAHAWNGSEEALHHMSPEWDYTRLLAKFQPYRPIGSSEKCNCLLRMRTTVQSKFNIKNCLQVIANA